MATVGFQALKAARTDPVTRYAAFVSEFVTRYRSSEYLRDHYPKLWTIMVAEERRLRRDHPREWAAGGQLLAATKRVASGDAVSS